MKKGFWIFKMEWYSICSIHFTHNKECDMCKNGRWINVWLLNLSQKLYHNYPKIWKIIANL